MRVTLCLVLALVATAACHRRNDPPSGEATPRPDRLQLGDPLPGLTEAELAAFERGKVLFAKRFKPSEGLGPRYNATSCKSCHSRPTMGGGSDLYRNFYLAAIGEPPMQTNLPGLPSQVLPAFGSSGSQVFTLESGRMELIKDFFGIPVQSAQRNGIPIFGVGLFERISNATILANADPDDEDQDGISGRANNDGAGMGRFGTKAQSNNIEFFTRAPLMNQMGITSDPFLGVAGTISHAPGMVAQGTGTPNSPTADDDGVPDPEIAPADLGDLIAFSRFLAPPSPLPFDDAARRGEATFESIGCTKCHLPSLTSSNGPVRAYTDLLIHDMGDELADNINFGTPQASATSPPHSGREWRTAPLWGISHFAPYLHDGRAATLDEAIRAHDGEAAAIRAAYVDLSDTRRDDVLTFLRHL